MAAAAWQRAGRRYAENNARARRYYKQNKGGPCSSGRQSTLSGATLDRTGAHLAESDTECSTSLADLDSRSGKYDPMSDEFGMVSAVMAINRVVGLSPPE